MSSNFLRIPVFYFILFFAFDFKSCVNASTLEGSHGQKEKNYKSGLSIFLKIHFEIII